jgi:ketosteroid isomerase-like protein
VFNSLKIHYKKTEMIGEEIDVAVEVRKANTEFYRAFESLSIEMMDSLWKHDDDVICVHPGRDLFTGWLAIRESWTTIFRNTEMIRFIITNTKIRVFDNRSRMAIVACQENIESSINGQLVSIGVIATNIFERNKNHWLLVHHHGSSISNYLPPNISAQ